MRSSLKPTTTLFVIGLALFGACKQRQPGGASSLRDDTAPSATTGFSDQSEALWGTYVQTISSRAVHLKRTLQPACYPARFHPQGAPFRGIALLFHGFTACPQQWYDFGQLLAAQGYEVLMPLAPGHGYSRNENTVGTNWINDEFVEELPDNTQASIYSNFVSSMVEVVRATQGGDKFVAGLSMGGAMSMQAALMTDDNGKGIFARAFVGAPYFAPNPSTPGPRVVAKATIPIIRDTMIGWDGPLRLSEKLSSAKSVCANKPARAGICTWRIKHLAGASNYGQQVLDSVKPVPGTQIQFLVAHNEGAIDIAKLMQAYRNSGGKDSQAPGEWVGSGDGGSWAADPATATGTAGSGDTASTGAATDQTASSAATAQTPVTGVYGCELMSRPGEAQIPHSFFSLEDNWPFVADSELKAHEADNGTYPTTIVYPAQMYWMKPFFAQTLKFAVSGAPFDAQAADSGDQPDAPFYPCVSF